MTFKKSNLFTIKKPADSPCEPASSHVRESYELLLNQKVSELEGANQKLRKQSKMLLKAKVFYEDFYEQAPDMFLSINTADRRIISCNKTLARTLGYKKKELLNMRVVDLYHPDSLEKAHAAREELLAFGYYTNVELQLRKKNGDKLHIAGSATAIRDRQGRIVKSRVAWRDITALVKARELADEKETALDKANASLRTMNSTLKELNKDLDSLIHIASHDLRAPLRAIHSFSQLIGQDPQDTLSPSSQLMLGQLRQKTIHMENFIKDIMEYYHKDADHPSLTMVELEKLLQEVTEMLDFPQGFLFKFKGEPLTFRTNRTPLYQILHNLINNAIYYHNNPQKGVISVTCKPCNEWLEFCVKDNGPGIKPEFHKQIFEPFLKIKIGEKKGGSGIGLALVKKLVERYGGVIEIESTPGNGASFKFTWPYLK